MSSSKHRDTPKRSESQVLDPVSHLPVLIHDSTDADLDEVSPLKLGSTDPRSVLRDCMSGVVYEELSSSRWQVSPAEAKTHMAIFVGLAVELGSIASLLLFWVLGPRGRYNWTDVFRATAACTCAALAAASSVIFIDHPALNRRQDNKSNDEDPTSNTSESNSNNEHDSPESAIWLNSMVKNLWPIVNPSLFVSVSDMIEDTLQASLPKLINGVRVTDIGQGSEPLRILGIRGIQAEDNSEDGEFVNLEVAVAYRAQFIEGDAKSLKNRSRNAHLLMHFWMAGSVKLPVWVELSGIVATLRLRLQLTPNPPFLSRMTLTLLGQPKVAMKCTPLAKNFLNVMDIPGLSSWVHESIDAAISSYVAPQSLTLDLKTLLSGKEMMDTDAIGVMIVNVKSAKGFRDGDGGKLWKGHDERTGDGYVTVSWAKWGKPLWSTRIIQNEKEPVWDETTVLLITAAETNAREQLRLQLWDSDRFTADDLLGTVEVPLLDLMQSSDTLNKTQSRKDGFSGPNGTEGGIEWSCGYFSKTTVEQHIKASIDNVEHSKYHDDATLRQVLDTSTKEVEEKLTPLEKEDFKEKCDETIAEIKPSEKWPSGILSIRIGQIDGLEVPNVRQSGVKGEEDNEDNDDLPSPYCTIVLNHQRIYKTRTKMKNNKPYYNAGTERFIRDWHKSIVMIAVRDQRLHEPDPLIGVVVLPLHHLFREHSQVTDSLPLIGGLGFGRLQFSLFFRSVQVDLPRQLRGWDVGTLDIQPTVHPSDNLPADLKSCKLILRTLSSKGKLAPQSEGFWKQKNERDIRLSVTKRYSSCLLVMLRKKVLGPDLTPAFGTLWLKDIPDDEEVTITVPIHRNSHDELKRARVCAISDIGEKIGDLTFKLRFWPGLSGYHKNLSDHDENMSDIMDILDCAEDSEQTNNESLYDPETDSSDSSDEGDSGSRSSSKSGLLGEVKNFRKQKGELHRKHRGLLQWSAARHLAWIGRGVEDKAGHLKTKVESSVKHRQFDSGVETEV